VGAGISVMHLKFGLPGGEKRSDGSNDFRWGKKWEEKRNGERPQRCQFFVPAFIKKRKGLSETAS